ncbi:hypothetical protein CDD83_8355 [Cordyceps sp. RAO-2017]|nr:hypothetical protein CDD83_8355 [Cordyceps sp. RAO-2017]
MYARRSQNLDMCQAEHYSSWDALRIPPMLLEALQAAQSAALLALPTETLLQIVEHAGPVDRLFLALTCKPMLAICSMTNVTIPSAPKHYAHNLGCPAMLAILRIMVPRGPGRRRKTSWGLCRNCYRYRPKKKGYWDRVVQGYREELACGMLVYHDEAIHSWSKRHSVSYQCPQCWCEDRMRNYAHMKK